MAAGLLEPLVVFWKESGILLLVLLSFSLQVILLITAEIRRRKDSGVLKVVVWSAYLLADTTAIYALGHMSVISPTGERNQLMAFWAPFLLLHLGGQDNITAYSIEDNRLWLRHLQNFFVQILAAAYVLYQSSIVARRTLLRTAAILMFVVGVVKYGERVCALKLACIGSNLSGKNYRDFSKGHDAFNLFQPRSKEEVQQFQAHALMDYAKNLLKGPLFFARSVRMSCKWEELYGVAEMQLSLMHDVFYSKSELIHTWHGFWIRAFSLSATVASLALFRQFSEKDGYRRADVAATYVLLGGAVILEITSVLKAMFSTWIYGTLFRAGHSSIFSCTTGFTLMVVGALARLFWIPPWFQSYAMCRGGILATKRYWAGSLGQHNLIHMCSQCMYSRGSKIARWMGREDLWNMLVYTSSVPVLPDISRLLKIQMMASKHVNLDSPDHIQNSRGRAALKRRPRFYEELAWSVDNELDESILVWHIATHVYLSWYKEEHTGPPHHLAQVTQELSNYMMFLLAARPYMLPDNTSRQRYIQLCYIVTNGLEYATEEGLLRVLRRQGDRLIHEPAQPTEYTRSRGDNITTHFGTNVTLDRACHLGAMLIRQDLGTRDGSMLELMSQVWVELMCYAAARCSPSSHARQLSNGGEFTTIVALLIEYAKPVDMGDLIEDDTPNNDSMAKSTAQPGTEGV